MGPLLPAQKAEGINEKRLSEEGTAGFPAEILCVDYRGNTDLQRVEPTATGHILELCGPETEEKIQLPVWEPLMICPMDFVYYV